MSDENLTLSDILKKTNVDLWLETKELERRIQNGDIRHMVGLDGKHYTITRLYNEDGTPKLDEEGNQIQRSKRVDLFASLTRKHQRRLWSLMVPPEMERGFRKVIADNPAPNKRLLEQFDKVKSTILSMSEDEAIEIADALED